MPKKKEAPPPPPAPFETGDRVKLRPGLLARYPLWRPKATEGTVERVLPALPTWAVWTRLGEDLYTLDGRDLEKA
jgi:hypothetical protein